MDEIPETCTVEGCDDDYYALDRCQRHYKLLPHITEWAAEYTSRPEVRRRNAERARRRSALQRAVALVWPIPAEALDGRMAVLNDRCWMCGAVLADIDATPHFDHVKPLSRGGAHTASNLRASCPTCNISKSGRWPVDTSTAAARLNPSRLP
jgi:5-methylcytosine-specific restriction endonuclease McrA